MAKVDEVRFGYIDVEWTDRVIRGGRRRTSGKQAGGTCGSQSHGRAGEQLAPVVIDGILVRLRRGDRDWRLHMRGHLTISLERDAVGKAAITSVVVKIAWA